MSLSLRKLAIILIDILLVNLALFLAFMLHFNWDFYSPSIKIYFNLVLPVTVLRLMVFYGTGLYDWSFRYASLAEAIRLFASVTVGSLAIVTLTTFLFMHRFRTDIGRTVLIIEYLFCLFLIGGFRFSFRITDKMKRRYRGASTAGFSKKLLIVGAGDTGEAVARAILNEKDSECRLVGFVDDDSYKQHARIHDVQVLGTTEEIAGIVKENGVDEIIIAIPSVPGKFIRDIVKKCERLEVKLKTVPRLADIVSGKVDVKKIRDVQPEDLLGREEVSIHGEEVRKLIYGKVILVTGAGGTIGSELCRQLAPFGPKLLLLLDQNENEVYFLKLELHENFPGIETRPVIGDIKDIAVLKHVFSAFRPQIVFHAAAHKHVPLMEENPCSAVKNNVIGTRNLIYAANHYRIEKFVFISSDKAVNPTSVMGATKRIAEVLLQAKSHTSKTRFMAVRFGNVIGSSGSVVPIFKRQIEKGGPVTVTHPDVTRYFMTASEAAQLVIQAASMGKGGEIFVLDMGEQIRIFELARNLITMSGFAADQDIEIKMVGLRPGEKLYEEILHDTEHDQVTKHEKIYVSSVNGLYPLKDVQQDIKKLERLAQLMDSDGLIQKISEMTQKSLAGVSHSKNQSQDKLVKKNFEFAEKLRQ